MWMMSAIEGFFSMLPHRLRRWLGNLRGVQNLLFISIRAMK
jgi:hypothetical protein